MTEERFDILNPEGNATGQSALKSEVHQKGLWHHSAHVWIYNSQGKILVQKRAKTKKLFPNVWDVSVAGHVVSGETPLLGAVREMEEELGIITGAEHLDFKGIYRISLEVDEERTENEFYYIYFHHFGGELSSLTLQEEEVAEVAWKSVEELEREVVVENRYYPHGKEYYDFVLEALRKRLF
ncbi:MAG: NUDIX domain-containing protein [bacterium]|nr:NUDIX domain-containing protein [bacterium]